jgi:serine/threonine protein kinase
LKIAKEIANAVAYLHTAFPRPIIHRDIKPANIFLNQNYAAKLSDFSFSISIPEGESKVGDDLLVGTFGFLDPDYTMTNFVTERLMSSALGCCCSSFLLDEQHFKGKSI